MGRRSPPHIKPRLAVLCLQRVLVELDDMRVSRTTVELLHELLESLLGTLCFAFDLEVFGRGALLAGFVYDL